MRGEEVDDLIRRESSVSKTREDSVDGVSRSWNGAILSRDCRVRASSEELKLRSTRAVTETNCCSELDQISSGDKMAGQERRECIRTVGCASVLGEICLDVREEEDRSVGSITLELAGEGERDTVVEGQAEGLMDVLTTFTLEKVLLQVVAEREERAAL